MPFSQRQLLIITALVAYCSILYELLLAQCLAVTLGHAVLRYTLTIGLYLFALGAGAWWVALRPPRHPRRRLAGIEAALAVIGGTLPFWVFTGDWWLRGVAPGAAPLLLSLWLHGGILVIGWLSGCEIPLLMSLSSGRPGAVRQILAVDYIATFAGTVIFPAVIYTSAGLVAGAATTGLCNAMAGILVARGRPGLQGGFVAIAAGTLALWWWEAPLRELLSVRFFLDPGWQP